MTDSPRENPFPPQAVTTYGVRPKAVAELKYMREVQNVLDDYLLNFPGPGVALALSGEHGSGKTFLLHWLALAAPRLKRAPARAIYAKTDDTRLPDVYGQLMRNFTRTSLAEVAQSALVEQGAELTAGSLATQTDSATIRERRTIDVAIADQIVTVGGLQLRLRKALEKGGVASDVSRKVAAAIGLLDDPDYGEGAFDWLCGKSAALPNEALAAPLFDNNDSGAAAVIVDALETIAALFRLAGIRLVVLLDQLENFLSSSGPDASNSILKKLIEALRNQSAMIIMTGTPAGWSRLPRDVGPRLYNRVPMPVGNLQIKETEALLNAYLDGKNAFPSSAITMIQDLCGGNSREALQIAYYAFKDVDGRLDSLTLDTLTKAAQDSGTLADRSRLALQILDDIASQMQLTCRPVGDKGRLLKSPAGAQMQVVLAVATSAKAEVEQALGLTALRRTLSEQPGSVEMLVLAIGYSSQRVQTLIQAISSLIVVQESDLKDELRTQLQKFAAIPAVAIAGSEAPSPELLKQLGRIAERLAKIEQSRDADDKRIAERLVAGTEALAMVDRHATELRTRHQLRIGLDNLSDALNQGHIGDERECIQGLLIANEANVKDVDFDYLGGIYLDALDARQISARIDDMGQASSSAGQSRPKFGALEALQADLIVEMRRVLTSKRFVHSRYATAGLTLLAAFAAIGSYYLFYYATVYLPRSSSGFAPVSFGMYLSYSAITAIIFVGAVATATFFGIEFMKRPEFQFRTSRLRLKSLRAEMVNERVASPKGMPS
jgi:hypothetical protein